MDGLDRADGDFLRAARRDPVRDDLACDRLPEAERVGILRIPTTRGDRLFISLVSGRRHSSVWIGFVGTDTIATLPVGEGFEISSLWLATVISLVSAAAIFRTV